MSASSLTSSFSLTLVCMFVCVYVYMYVLCMQYKCMYVYVGINACVKSIWLLSYFFFLYLFPFHCFSAYTPHTIHTHTYACTCIDSMVY